MSFDNHIFADEQAKWLDEMLQFGVEFSQWSGALQQSVQPRELTPLQWEMLQVVAAAGETSLSQICDCTKQSLPNGSRELKKLVLGGWVQKHQSPWDRRESVLSLSPSGGALVHQAYGQLKETLRQHLADRSSQEWQELAQALWVVQKMLLRSPGNAKG